MEYIEQTCPHCQETMQVPVGKTSIICMFCGETITVANAKSLDAREQEKRIKSIQEELPKMLLEIENGFKSFRRDTYSECFQTIYRNHIDTLTAVEELYQACSDQESVIEEIAESFVKTVEKRLESVTKKNVKEQQQIENNLMMVAYVFPCILEYKGKSSKVLADAIAEKWRQVFKNSDIHTADYNQINSGFRKKLCYVTTAVCESLGKGEDCYELTVLKNYRDSYLLQEEGGEELIRQYYNLAPTIVKRINKSKDATKIYKDLYQQYISPCITMIEENENEACKELYTNMVQDLYATYMGS